VERFGAEWAGSFEEGLPDWTEVPGEVNIAIMLRLRNLALAFDMVEFAKMRYNLLGSAGNWFPGFKFDKFLELREKDPAQLDADLASCLRNSPHGESIPAALYECHELLAGEDRKRLQQDED